MTESLTDLLRAESERDNEHRIARAVERGWPDTRDQDPPGYAWGDARWLVGRHGMLADLVERAGCWTGDEEGRWVDLNQLKQTIRGLDAYRAAWAEYQTLHPAPSDDARYDAWEAAGPDADDVAPCVPLAGILPMSGSEVGRLRLLATIGNGRIEFSLADLDGWDFDGQATKADWARLL